MIQIPKKLIEHKEEIRNKDPQSHSIKYDKDFWDKWLAKIDEYEYVCGRFAGQISRGQINQLANEATNDFNLKSVKKVFIATMLWGYGRKKYGPYRTLEMLNDPNFSKTATESFKDIISGNILTAYRDFRMKWCGPAFFTKYFYFIGLGCDVEPKPLILDSVMARVLDQLLPNNIDEFVKVRRKDDGKINHVRRYAEGYVEYVVLLNSWAKDLNCRPDSIELASFQCIR